jgi:hypothetical protein
VGFQHMTDIVNAAAKKKRKKKRVGRMRVKFVLP